MNNFLIGIITTLTMLIYNVKKCHAQETIKIFHGQNHDTRIVEVLSGKKLYNSTNHTVSIGEKEEIIIEIINPNPVLYNYKFNKSDLKIEDDALPDISLLVKSLSSILGLPIPETSTPAMGALPSDSELKKLYEDIKGVKDILSQIKALIEESDIPESYDIALKYTEGNTGFRKSKRDIYQLFVRNKLAEAESKLLTQLQKVVNANEFPSLDGNSLKIYEDAFKAYISNLSNLIKDVENNFISSKVRAKIYYSYNAESKPVLFKVKIEPKSKDFLRDTGNVVVLNIRPHKTSAIEIVPYYSALHSTGNIKYEISNGLILQNKENDFTFRAGASIILNVARFGPYNDFSVGPALGFSLKDNTNFLNNLSFGGLISYKEIVRIGLAWGVQQYQSSLKEGASIGKPLPLNVNGINDIIQYSPKSAFMINFSILGLKLP